MNVRTLSTRIFDTDDKLQAVRKYKSNGIGVKRSHAHWINFEFMTHNNKRIKIAPMNLIDARGEKEKNQSMKEKKKKQVFFLLCQASNGSKSFVSVFCKCKSPKQMSFLTSTKVQIQMHGRNKSEHCNRSIDLKIVNQF